MLASSKIINGTHRSARHVVAPYAAEMYHELSQVSGVERARELLPSRNPGDIERALSRANVVWPGAGAMRMAMTIFSSNA